MATHTWLAYGEQAQAGTIGLISWVSISTNPHRRATQANESDAGRARIALLDTYRWGTET